MPTMTKRVNINAPVAIRTITPPIYGRVSNIVMTTGDILKCLCKRAVVDEILPDGSTVRLTMKNYYTDNGAGLDAKKVEVVSQPAKVSEVKKDEEKKSSDEPKVDDVASKTEGDVDIVTDNEPVAVVDPAIVNEGKKINTIEMVVDPAIEVVSTPNTDTESVMKLHEYSDDKKESEEAETAFVTGLSIEGDELTNNKTESVTTVASTETSEGVVAPAEKQSAPKKKSSGGSKKKSTSSSNK